MPRKFKTEAEAIKAYSKVGFDKKGNIVWGIKKKERL